MPKQLARLTLCGLAMLFAPLLAQADEPRTTETVFVTAGRIAEHPKAVTQAATIIPHEEIEKNLHKTLEDVLLQNGVQIMRTAPDTTAIPQITLRGLRSSQDDPNQGSVMLLVDGRRIASANIAMIPIVSVERVEIIRGPSAVQYGTSAMGGVVNIITKRGGEQTQASLELGGGSWETWRGMAGISGMAGDFDYALGLSQSTRARDWKDGDGNRIDNSSYNTMTMYSANVGYTFLDTHRVGLSFIGANYDRLRDPGDQNWPSPHAFSDRNGYALDVNYEGGLKEYGLSWMLRYSNSKEKYLYHDTASIWPASTNRAKNQGTQAQLTWKYDFLTLTGGVDWTEAKYITSGYIDECRLSNVGGFLLGKAAFMDENLVFSAGVRYDDFNLKFAETDRNKGHTSLSAGVAYSPLDWLTLRANIGDSYRMPTGLEAAGYAWGSTKYIGNPNLKPEKGLGWDAGFEINYNAFKAGLTYFSTDYDDKIATRPVGLDSQYYNISGTAKYRGLEGQASVDVGQFFDWPFMLRPYVTFTHMLKYEDDKGNDIPFVRDWIVGFGVNYAYPDIGLDIDLRLIYLGDQKEDIYNYTTWTNEVITTGGDVTADLTVNKQIYEWEDYGNLSVKGEIRNLFDKQYALKYGYPMQGRSFFVSLCWKY